MPEPDHRSRPRWSSNRTVPSCGRSRTRPGRPRLSRMEFPWFAAKIAHGVGAPPRLAFFARAATCRKACACAAGSRAANQVARDGQRIGAGAIDGFCAIEGDAANGHQRFRRAPAGLGQQIESDGRVRGFLGGGGENRAEGHVVGGSLVGGGDLLEIMRRDADPALRADHVRAPARRRDRSARRARRPRRQSRQYRGGHSR